MNLKITNTFSRKKELFVPQNPDEVTLYVCGITPYSYSHIGHARVYIVFDILNRVLRARGKKVTYIRNFTDIDDKILDRIPLPHTDIQGKIKNFVDPFIYDFLACMEKLNCFPANHTPRVTQTIPEIIDLIEKLISRGHAYVVGHDVYFDIASYPEYGKLSCHPLENLLAGSRVEVVDGKRNPGDFALWKGNADGLYWKSLWGHGRPGWHIECSAMVGKHTKTLDIHGGGADLLFPHHENERAQSEAGYGHQLAKYWMHVEFLLMNKEKMSKSLGNVMLIRDVLAKHKPMAFRFLILQHGYNKPLSYSDDDLAAAGRAFERLNDALWDGYQRSYAELYAVISSNSILPLITELFDAVEDDLGTSKAIALIFENLSQIKQSPDLRAQVRAFCTFVLGLEFCKPEEKEITAEVARLIAEREQARAEKNWARSDEIRDELARLGHVVQDKKI